MKQLLQNKPLVIGLVLLTLGQLLYLFNFTTLYVLSLIYVLVLGLPYPEGLRSLLARVAAAVVITLSLLQLLGAVQFFVFPHSDFRVLSLLVFLTVGASTWAFRHKIARERIVMWSRTDIAAIVAMLFFVLPLSGVCYWKNSPVHLTYFGGMQSPDGVAHYAGLAEMTSQQHLDYRTVEYYPKGFHLAGAFVLKGLHASPHQLSWRANAQIYFGMYVVLGGVLALLLAYLGILMLQSLMNRVKLGHLLLLAVVIGPALALIYLLPFVYDGFLNYLYICAAVVLGGAYLYDYRDRFEDQWRLLVYLLLAFGVGMSWGPLLTPALLLAPLMYIFANDLTLRSAISRAFNWRRYWPIVVAYIAQLAPLYLHFKYAKLAEAQGINAEGIVRYFHFGVLLLGLIVLVWMAMKSTKYPSLKQYVVNVFTPFYILTGLLVAIQYFSTGELRYYAIKTAYTLELLILVVSAAGLTYLIVRGVTGLVQQWAIAPMAMLFAILLLVGISGANPLLEVRQMLRPFNNFGEPAFYSTDVRLYTQLANTRKIDDFNSADMHYDANGSKIYGDSLIDNWVESMLPAVNGSARAADCGHTLFMNLAYGVGRPEEQVAIINAAKQCIAAANQRQDRYYIITDAQSVPYLRSLLGKLPVYITPHAESGEL